MAAIGKRPIAGGVSQERSPPTGIKGSTAIDGNSRSLAFSRGSLALHAQAQGVLSCSPESFFSTQQVRGADASAMAAQQHSGLAMRSASSVARMERKGFNGSESFDALSYS